MSNISQRQNAPNLDPAAELSVSVQYARCNPITTFRPNDIRDYDHGLELFDYEVDQAERVLREEGVENSCTIELTLDGNEWLCRTTVSYQPAAGVHKREQYFRDEMSTRRAFARHNRPVLAAKERA